MKAEDAERLKKYVEAALIPRYNTDRRKYPIYAGRLGRLYLDVLSNELSNDIEEFIDKGHTIKDLANIFNNPTRIMRMTHTILAGMRMNNLPIEKQRRVILTLLDVVKAMKYGGEFCEDGRNLILSPREISDLLEKESFVQANKESSRLAQTLCGVLWAYAETLYFVCHGIAMEAHGPYGNPRNSSQVVLIRDFFNMRPIDLWQECERVPFENVRLIATHENVDVWFDVFDNIYIRKGNLVESLRFFSVTGNGRSLSLDEIKELSNILNRTISSITGKVDSWTEREIAGKYMEIFWYQVKPLKEALGKNWRPPQIVLHRAADAEIPPPSDKRPTEDSLRQEMSLV